MLSWSSSLHHHHTTPIRYLSKPSPVDRRYHSNKQHHQQNHSKIARNLKTLFIRDMLNSGWCMYVECARARTYLLFAFSSNLFGFGWFSFCVARLRIVEATKKCFFGYFCGTPPLHLSDAAGQPISRFILRLASICFLITYCNKTAAHEEMSTHTNININGTRFTFRCLPLSIARKQYASHFRFHFFRSLRGMCVCVCVSG